MKKNFIKHSSVVVAALLAAASVGAATGNVKADTTNTVTENGHFETVTTDKGSEDQPKANTTAGTKVTPKTDNPTLSDSKGDQSAQGGQKQNTPASGTQTGNNTSTGNASDSTNTSNDNVTQGSNTNAGSTIGNTTNGSNQGTTNNGQTTNGSTTTTGTTTNINGTQNTTNSNSTTETTSTSTTSAAKPVVRIAQRSYVYTKSGKIARKNGKRVVLKKSSTRSLSNAKLVTIKGQKYYQIGKNQYVKASNVIAPIRKANVRAVVKGRKNARVRAYTSTGKRTRSYLSGRKSYKFTARRSINGRTYYKVSGKNLWIPASKLNIR